MFKLVYLESHSFAAFVKLDKQTLKLFLTYIVCLNLSRDDDDINDVASMAGVNLSEESARILATNSELVGAVTRSCKDEAFLSASMLQHKILEIGATSSYRKIFDFTTMYCFTRANSCSPECGQAKGLE